MHAIVYTCNGMVLKALGTDDTISTELSTYKICMSEVMTQNEWDWHRNEWDFAPAHYSWLQ